MTLWHKMIDLLLMAKWFVATQNDHMDKILRWASMRNAVDTQFDQTLAPN